MWDDIEDHREVDLFGGVTPGPLPLLETLKIRGAGRVFPGSQILELLSLAPNLTECIFHDVDPMSVYDLHFISEKLVLPNLRRLSFGPGTTSPESDDDVLKYLSLPRLQTLSLPLHYVSADGLLSFLERSSPPLQELVVGQGSKLIESNRLHDYFRLVPALTCFEAWRPNFALMTGIIRHIGRFILQPPQPPHSDHP
ncbi:hypothetical protein MVEN_02502800 [Mycena venus]|uniref:Uncharacterized protein n=1 Tax=Mycena venus TaxID=2733690 RepID=A0A8H6WT09_9AGAR|nr:hypothetical protein MVEN_02502800 [Mycena venus]